MVSAALQPTSHRLRQAAAGLAVAALTLTLAGPAAAFGFDDVAALARREAALPYREPVKTLPAAWAALGYDALRDLRYRPDAAIWRSEALPFELQFFHLGGGQQVAVPIHEIAAGTPLALAYDPAAWNFGPRDLPALPTAQAGHAGFRVHYALNSPQYKDELIAFLGASYFRALGRGQHYGLSARGLAIDTVGGAGPEEFPRFSSFWIERPAPGATALTVHALLDSARATGAFRFVIRPGVDVSGETVVDVQARLFQRAGAAPIATLGIAPLTSMFLHGENQPRSSDFRPEVHDSDGLLVAGIGPGGGAAEWLWRPLFNPVRPQASSFSLQRLQGFGLMQRDRRFASYEDTEALYERRPSVWVEPLGDWGPGRVELLLLPTPDETHDNVVAYWVPAGPPPAGQPLDLSWRLHWQGDQPQQPPSAATVQTRRGTGWGAATAGASEMNFIVDFDGPALRALPPGAAVEVVASSTPVGQRPAARVLEARTWPHPQGGWRMQLRVQRASPGDAIELRAYLRRSASTDALTETWTALVPQDTP
jgi:glucans biosynthesis protein